MTTRRKQLVIRNPFHAHRPVLTAEIGTRKTQAAESNRPWGGRLVPHHESIHYVAQLTYPSTAVAVLRTVKCISVGPIIRVNVDMTVLTSLLCSRRLRHTLQYKRPVRQQFGSRMMRPGVQ